MSSRRSTRPTARRREVPRDLRPDLGCGHYHRPRCRRVREVPPRPARGLTHQPEKRCRPVDLWSAGRYRLVVVTQGNASASYRGPRAGSSPRGGRCSRFPCFVRELGYAGMPASRRRDRPYPAHRQHGPPNLPLGPLVAATRPPCSRQQREPTTTSSRLLSRASSRRPVEMVEGATRTNRAGSARLLGIGTRAGSRSARASPPDCWHTVLGVDRRCRRPAKPPRERARVERDEHADQDSHRSCCTSKGTICEIFRKPT